MVNQQETDLLGRSFRALSDVTRRNMVERLTQGSASVGELAEPFEMTLPAVLQHVQVLEAAGLVRSEKVGRLRVCHVDRVALRTTEDWFARQRAAWEQRLDRLGDYLSEKPPADTGGA